MIAAFGIFNTFVVSILVSVSQLSSIYALRAKFPSARHRNMFTTLNGSLKLVQIPFVFERTFVLRSQGGEYGGDNTNTAGSNY